VSLQGTGILLEFLFHPVPLPFFYVENLKGIPVPVKKTEGTGIPQVLPSLHTST
jgi:hypothetical protein